MVKIDIVVQLTKGYLAGNGSGLGNKKALTSDEPGPL
jgi:hypothetical protein